MHFQDQNIIRNNWDISRKHKITFGSLFMSSGCENQALKYWNALTFWTDRISHSYISVSIVHRLLQPSNIYFCVSIEYKKK